MIIPSESWVQLRTYILCLLLKVMSLKSVMKIMLFRIFKIILVHLPITYAEWSVRILRIRWMNHIQRINGMNMYVCNEHVEWGKSSNGISLYVFTEYAEWICSNTENMQNAQKVDRLREFETKIENILGRLSWANMNSFGQSTLNQKISCKVFYHK